MSPSPAPTPARARDASSEVVAATLLLSLHDTGPAVAARLFAADYDACDGRVASMATSPTRVAVAAAAAAAAARRRLDRVVLSREPKVN